MSILRMEGFEGGETDAAMRTILTNKGYGSMHTDVVRGPGRVTGTSYQSGNFTGAAPQLGWPTVSDCYIGFGFYYDKSGTAAGLGGDLFAAIGQSGVNISLALYVIPDTQQLLVKVNTGGSFVTLTTTAVDSLTRSEWHWIQIRLRLHATLDTLVKIVVDGVTLVDTAVAADASRPTAANYFVLYDQPAGSGKIVRFDDFFVRDDALPDRKTITRIDPTSDDEATWSTFGSGSGHVDRLTDDSILTGVESAASGGLKEVFNYDGIAGVTGIVGLQINTELGVSTDDPTLVKTVVRSGATEFVDSGISVDLALGQYAMKIIETDPDTGLEITEAGLAAMKFGVES